MRNLVKLPLSFDAARLREDLAGLDASVWVPHFNKAYYEGEWGVVALRSAGGSAEQIYPDPTRSDFADTPTLARCPRLREALGAFRCPLQAVRLLRLAPGTVIREHKDYRLGFEDGEVRVHVPLRTNPGVEFYLGGERVLMAEGETWYINFNLPHSVRNLGTTDRVHLVIDCVVDDWLRALFPAE